MHQDALTRAITVIGSQAALGRLCGKSTGHVWWWLHKSKRVPAEFVLRIEAATGVPRHELRPDVFPPPDGETERDSATPPAEQGAAA